MADKKVQPTFLPYDDTLRSSINAVLKQIETAIKPLKKAKQTLCRFYLKEKYKNYLHSLATSL